MFVRKKAKNTPTGIRETVAGITNQIDHLIAIIQDPSSPASDRITATEIVRSFVDFQSLSSITEIWYATSKLTAIENTPEVRRAGWRLCLSCISRDELNNSAFTAYYASIIRNANIEDFELVLSCLEQLTKGGRRVVGTQAPRHLPQVLLEWIQLLAVRSQEIRNNSTQQDVALQWGASTEASFHRLVNYTISLLKFNMPVWEPMEIEELLLVAVAIVRQTSLTKDCELCCLMIEAVLAYGLIPAAVLQPILEVLCGIISMVPPLRELSERIIFSLSSGHLQNSTFVRLCRILDAPNSEITTSMQIAAAQQLETLLVRRSRESKYIPDSSDHTGDSNSKIRGGVLDDRSIFINNPGDNHEDPVDPSLPVDEILEAYFIAAKNASSQPKLIIALVQCCNELIVDFGLLKYVRSTGISDNESISIASPEVQDASLKSLILLFSQIYSELQEKNAAEEPALYDEIRKTATLIVESFQDKDLASSMIQQILLGIRISKFMTVETCESLLTVIDRMQFCTPGVYEWFSHLQEVMKYIYTQRTDRCRARILHSIQDIYALDAQEEGWISLEGLAWMTSTTFEALGSADEVTLKTLLEIYETRVFYTQNLVFSNATLQLVNAAVNDGIVQAVEALNYALSRAFKLHAKQALTIIDALQRIALDSTENPDVFKLAWSVLCRFRNDRWGRLCIIEQGVAEEAYGTDLLSMQVPLPERLRPSSSTPSLTVKVRTDPRDTQMKLNTSRFIEAAIRALKCSNEQTFILVLINLASQLAHYQFMCNPKLSENFAFLRLLRDEIMQLINEGGSRMPQSMSSSRRNACLNVLVHVLTILQPLKELFSKSEHDRAVQVIVQSLGQRNIHTSWAVHYLMVACYESPSSIQRFLPQIISRLQLRITSRDSSVFILDFLLSIGLRSSLTRNFTNQDYKRVFGMSFLFIQNANDMLSQKDRQRVGAQWHLQLAYLAITNLFLSIKLENRRSLVPYLTRTIALTNKDRNRLDPLNLVTYDLINRFTYSDVPLRVNMVSFPDKQAGWEVRRWLRGLAVIEIRCNRQSGEAIRVVRRPAGIMVTKMQPVLIDNIDSQTLDPESEDSGEFSANFYLLCGQLGMATFNCRFNDYDTLQRESNSDSEMNRGSRLNTESISSTAQSVTGPGSSVENADDKDASSSETAKMPTDNISGYTRPLPIPDDAASSRAIRSLDRVPIVDFCKVGIIYVAPGQHREQEILANSCGSPAYRKFLNRLGTIIRLKNNRAYYVGGLDTDQDLDGQYAIAWSSKIAQIIFHTTTMMPQLPGDTQFANKKRHIGNNFVNVYFDESGVDFVFDVVRSQFNFINIVITPTYLEHDGQRYWKVRVLKKEGMLNSLAAYEMKVVNESNLHLFVRNLALKASQYAAIHNLGTEYMDNWVYRMQLISSLHDRLIQSSTDQKQDVQPAKQTTNGESEENEGFLSDDDFLEEPDSAAEKLNPEIEILNWMDFTNFTI